MSHVISKSGHKNIFQGAPTMASTSSSNLPHYSFSLNFTKNTTIWFHLMHLIILRHFLHEANINCITNYEVFIDPNSVQTVTIDELFLTKCLNTTITKKWIIASFAAAAVTIWSNSHPCTDIRRFQNSGCRQEYDNWFLLVYKSLFLLA